MTGSLWPQDSAVEQPVGGTQRAYCRYGRWCTSGGFYCVCSMVGWLLRVILRVLQNWLYRSLSMLLTASLLFVCNTYFQHPFFSFKNEECYFVTLAVVHELMTLVQASDITPCHIIMNVVSIILNQIYSILFYFTSDDSSMTIILCTLKANTVVTCGFSYSNRVQQMVRTGRQKMRCCVVLYLLFFFFKKKKRAPRGGHAAQVWIIWRLPNTSVHSISRHQECAHLCTFHWYSDVLPGETIGDACYF